MAGLRIVAGVFLLAFLPACSGLLGTESVIESAHAVFLTRPDCPYVVTSETQRGFAVLTPQDDFAPRQGDLILGNLSTGALTLAVVPFDAETATRTVPFDIAGHDLSLAEAQAFYYGYCPLPPAAIPPGTPGLPLAPDGVPLDVPPDTTGAF
ncbi:MAG: hypothetical protein ABJF88_11425 [Rhodothermales bacterium]